MSVDARANERQTTMETTEATAQGKERRGLGALLIGVLLKPHATFAYLRTATRRYWVIPALLMVVALIAAGFAYAQANAEDLYQNQLLAFESMPPDQRGPMAEPPPKSSPHPLTIGVRVGGQLISTVAGWLIWAGLISLASTFFGQNGARFGAFFAMVVWAGIPYVVRNALQAVYMAVTGNAIYNQGLSGLIIDKAPTVSPAFGGPGPVSAVPFQRYVPPSRGDQILAAILGRVDVYLLWNLALMIIGVALFARISKKKSAAVVVAIWVLLTLVSLLPTLVGLQQGTRIF